MLGSVLRPRLECPDLHANEALVEVMPVIYKRARILPLFRGRFERRNLRLLCITSCGRCFIVKPWVDITQMPKLAAPPMPSPFFVSTGLPPSKAKGAFCVTNWRGRGVEDASPPSPEDAIRAGLLLYKLDEDMRVTELLVAQLNAAVENSARKSMWWKRGGDMHARPASREVDALTLIFEAAQASKNKTYFLFFL